jgi:hypothetical protein
MLKLYDQTTGGLADREISRLPYHPDEASPMQSVAEPIERGVFPSEAELAADPRWRAVEQIVASRHFFKAPLLSKFLFYVCKHALSAAHPRLTEHQIGVAVFGRRVGYNLGEDNIVRNYARQLRKRLAEYYQAEGQQSVFVIDIPRGGYVPTFMPQRSLTEAPRVESASSVHSFDRAILPTARSHQEGPQATPASPASRRHILWLLLYSIVLCGLSALLALGVQAHLHAVGPSDILWKQIFNADTDTFLVPSDSSAALYQNISRQRVSLADYTSGGYRDLPLAGADKHVAATLRGQRDTTVVDFAIATGIARLPEVVSSRLLVRFSRDLRMDDLKEANAILIGSRYSNPWAEVFEKNLNFRFEYRPEAGDSWISNQHPLAGESAQYFNEWDQPSHRTYAVIALVPNLHGTGHVLLIEGLDVAGTQAAAELLLRPAGIAPILAKVRQPNGTLSPFEVLLQTTSIGANAPSAHVIAWRMHSND